MTMKIILNGKDAEAREGETLAELAERLGLAGPFAAQVNDDIIPREKLPEATLKEGDRVEFFRVMAGG
ncbi:MAG: sulfur carrier protein ThiS [Candidatus Nitrospinota bacterium M3_3B_026]